MRFKYTNIATEKQKNYIESLINAQVINIEKLKIDAHLRVNNRSMPIFYGDIVKNVTEAAYTLISNTYLKAKASTIIETKDMRRGINQLSVLTKNEIIARYNNKKQQLDDESGLAR